MLENTASSSELCFVVVLVVKCNYTLPAGFSTNVLIHTNADCCLLNSVLSVLIARLSVGALVSQQPKTLHLLSDLFLDALGQLYRLFSCYCLFSFYV